MKCRARAFTLIELLIVVAIIGILAAIAVPNYLNARLRAMIARVEADTQALSVALESYRLDYNFYPIVGNCGGDLPKGRNSEQWPLKVLTSPVAFMGSLPMDPFWPGAERGQEVAIHDYGMYWYMDRRSRAWCGVPEAASFFVYESQLWALQSPGPDQQWSEDPSATRYGYRFHWLVFEMSNGLRSGGNIYRFGP